MIQKFIALQKVVEFRSFSKAADALGYTQSSVSEMVASLEKELNIRLLNRQRSGIFLTDEGKEIFPYIEECIYKYEAVGERAKEINGLMSGIIRIGVMGSVSTHWMPQILREFKDLYPGVRVMLHEGDYALISEWIKTGAVDFGFLNPDVVSGLETIELKKGLMPAIVPSNHPLAEKKTIPLELLAAEPFILLEEGLYYETLEAFRARNLSPHIEYIVHDDYTIMAMVEEGIGVSILPELILRHVDYKIAVRPTDPPVYRTVGIGYKDGRGLPIASRKFIELIKSKADELP